ncbi:hypothetical protein PLEOSDRAFT_1113486 [Pleurotus ostreatus PC15]|uniref:Uncharacterized protein n=1 Tax=Pleurotus ostreatus (strain PC15) TaxID=1137138 RepID=A0A067NPH4_PLEO1|nr:hypothetical protein PLEOSDRAFT_1113486 [Pleurotus ostreatus PC15]
MAWAVRRESILANEQSLRSQADGSFGWLEPSTVNIFGDEKVGSNPVERTLSPASTISSGPSSANTSPCPASTKGTFDDDSESDAGFDTDHSQYEPYYIDNDKYSVIDGKAYMIPTISQPVFGQTSYPGLPQLPILNNALSPMAEVRHLPQLPSTRTSSPLLPPFQGIDSRSPSPFLPLPAPLPPRDLSRGKRSRNTKTKRAKRTRRTSLILAEDSDRDAEGEADNASDDGEWVPSNQPKRSKSKKRSREDRSSQFDTWNFAAAQGSSNTTARSLAQIAPHDVRPAKRARPRTSPQSRNVQVPALSHPEDAIDDLSFKCSECGWVQDNKRLPDFRRHLLTHTRPDDRDQSRGWWCKGVLASSVPGFQGEAYEFNGELRFGGCLRTFSRRDALKRHLDNRNVCCLGSIHQHN